MSVRAKARSGGERKEKKRKKKGELIALPRLTPILGYNATGRQDAIGQRTLNTKKMEGETPGQYSVFQIHPPRVRVSTACQTNLTR